MSIELLRKRLKETINSGNDKTKINRFRHLDTALNNLIKKFVINEEDLHLALGDDLENTLSSYRSVLKKMGRSDRQIQAPLTRVRRLAEFYSELFELDASEMSFSELLQAAAHRMYGDKLWTGPVTPLTQSKILASNTPITFRCVASDIITAAVKEDQALWPKIDLAKNGKGPMGSACKVLRDYFTGESLPSVRVPDDRIYFIERYFHLPKGTLLAKVQRKIDHRLRGRKESELSKAALSGAKHKYHSLNKKLQRVFDEYSAYKIHKIQPEIRNISDKLKANRFFELDASVEENNKKKDQWTYNNLEACGSQTSFYNLLIGFLNYCISVEKIDFESVGTEHLANPLLIQQMVQNSGRKKGDYPQGTFAEMEEMKDKKEQSKEKNRNALSGTNAERILNWVYRGAQSRGYLRLCGDLGEQTVDEHYDAMDYILIKYKAWKQKVHEGINSTKGAQRGKVKIAFLSNMPVKERMRVMYIGTKFMMNQALGYQIEANASIKFAKKAHGPVSAETRYKSAASLITKAFNRASAAIIQEISFINSPRSGTWGTLKYYPNDKAKEMSFPSLTFLRQRNRFNFYVPVYSSSLINPFNNNEFRGLKNSDSENIVNIDVDLPERLTPLIKNFLSIRKDYIEMQLEHFGNASPSDVEWLLPWLSMRASDVKDEKEILRRKLFLQTSKRIGENIEDMTYEAYSHVLPSTKQAGYNIHGLRHLVGETHLDLHPGDVIGAAAKLNDTEATIIETYSDRDRGRAMKRITDDGAQHAF